VLILLFKNVFKISNSEGKTCKNLKTNAKKNFNFFLCMPFYWGGKNLINKKGLFYAKFFEFEVKS
jgi:hypothetical protein